jgi:hypothetical protein
MDRRTLPDADGVPATFAVDEVLDANKRQQFHHLLFLLFGTLLLLYKLRVGNLIGQRAHAAVHPLRNEEHTVTRTKDFASVGRPKPTCAL